jgi:hypothetical protein
VIEYTSDAVVNRLTLKETKGGTAFTATYTYRERILDQRENI